MGQWEGGGEPDSIGWYVEARSSGTEVQKRGPPCHPPGIHASLLGPRRGRHYGHRKKLFERVRRKRICRVPRNYNNIQEKQDVRC